MVKSCVRSPASHKQGICTLSWSLQPDISQPSQHILILRAQCAFLPGYLRNASVLDVLTERPINLHAGSCVGSAVAARATAGPCQEPMQQLSLGRERRASDMAQLNASNDQHECNESRQLALESLEHRPAQCIMNRQAAWAADARHVIMILQNELTSLHLADPCRQTGNLVLEDMLLRTTALVVTQPGEHFPQHAISPAGNMILSETSDQLGFDVCLNIYQLPSLQHHFLLAPLTRPVNFQTPFNALQFAWSPDGSKLAVWWLQDRPTVSETATISPPSAQSISYSIAIHCADTGKCLTSTMIFRDSCLEDMGSTKNSDSSDNEARDEGEDEVDYDFYFARFEWDPSSSYILWTYKGSVACIHPAQGQVWWSSCRQQFPDSSYQHATTNVGSAASGRFLLVADHPVGFLTMLDAMTGSVMSQWPVHYETTGKGIVWAAQSDVCLLPNHSFVLMPAAAAYEALQNGYSGHSPSCMSSRRPACKPEDSDTTQLTQHSWHKFALAAPAVPGSEGTPSPANLGLPLEGHETYTMHISPCGTVVVGVKYDGSGAIAGQPSGRKAMFQHWHLPHVQKCPRTPLAAGHATVHVQPQECVGLVMPSRDTVHMAWHPQPRACIYACYQYQVGLRLVNAKSDCIVRS